MRKISCAFLCFVLFGCNSRQKSLVASTDTAALLNTVFTFKPFYKTLNSEKDDIYILKTKYYNKSWPSRINEHRIIYIDDNQKTRTPSIYPHVDGRLRYGVSEFRIANDSALILLWQFTTPIYIRYHLNKKDGYWKIKSYEMGIQ